MAVASEIEPIAPDLSLWRAYDASIKTELFSTGLTTPSGTYLIDPIRLAPSEIESLPGVAGIIVTNENHTRSANDFVDRFQVPVYSAVSPSFPAGLTAIPIEGAAPREIAIHSLAAGGVIVMGDAFINFEPYGFTFLPAKYCTNHKLMLSSLEKLLDYPFERMFFAHGIPIQSRAHERLEALLRGDR